MYWVVSLPGTSDAFDAGAGTGLNLVMITAGSWPNWVQAGFTSLAVIVAALSYWRSVQVRREAQARLVYSQVSELGFHDAGERLDLLPDGAKIGVPGGGTHFVLPSNGDDAHLLTVQPVAQLTAVIHNGSKELIGPAKLQVVRYFSRGRGKTYETYQDFAALIDVIPPESEYEVAFTFPNEAQPGQPSLSTTLLFRDASGQWWRRFRAEPIEAVHDDPENDEATPAERATYAANARAAGYSPTPELTVPLRTRWHRLMRRARGKSPIP